MSKTAPGTIAHPKLSASQLAEDAIRFAAMKGYISRAFAIALLFAGGVLPSPASPPEGEQVAVFEVRFGKEKPPQRFVIALDDSAAPVTVGSFKHLVSKKFYNGMRFHRAFPDLLVQTGDPKSRRGQSDASGTGGPGFTLPAEIRLPAKKGAVAAARLPDTINPSRASNGSQFFVLLREMPELNGKYTVFGEVIEGMEVLERVSRTRTDSNDFPVEKIVIRRAFLEPRAGSAPQE